MDGWDWMVIIGHRYSKGTFGAYKMMLSELKSEQKDKKIFHEKKV